MKDKAVRIDKIRNRRGAFGRTKTLIKLALLAVVIVMTLSAASHIMDNIARVEVQHEAVAAQIAEAEARRQEIEDSVAYVESIEFIEYIARNMLNLVRRDEIIFIMTTE
jgi:cell division protein FtsB